MRRGGRHQGAPRCAASAAAGAAGADDKGARWRQTHPRRRADAWRPVSPISARPLRSAGASARVQPSRSAADHGRRSASCNHGMEITMTAVDTRNVYKQADYKSDVKPIWCPGCGDYHVLMSFTRTFAHLALPLELVWFFAGSGCPSRIPAYTNCYGFHGVHGRSLALAAGLKVTRPDLTRVVGSGARGG